MEPLGPGLLTSRCPSAAAGAAAKVATRAQHARLPPCVGDAMPCHAAHAGPAAASDAQQRVPGPRACAALVGVHRHGAAPVGGPEQGGVGALARHAQHLLRPRAGHDALHLPGAPAGRGRAGRAGQAVRGKFRGWGWVGVRWGGDREAHGQGTDRELKRGPVWMRVARQRAPARPALAATVW